MGKLGYNVLLNGLVKRLKRQIFCRKEISSGGRFQSGDSYPKVNRTNIKTNTCIIVSSFSEQKEGRAERGR